MFDLQQLAPQLDQVIQLEVRRVRLDVRVHLGPGGGLGLGREVGGVVKVEEAVHVPWHCTGGGGRCVWGMHVLAA